MLAHRLRRWPNIKSALGEHPVFDWRVLDFDREEMSTSNQRRPIVGSVRGDLGWNCAHLTTSMKICTLIVLDLLSSNLPGAKANSQRGLRV